MTETTTIDRRVADAEVYVRTRFYPPLPSEYGALAVEAVDACNSGDDEAEIRVSTELPILPKNGRETKDGEAVIVTAAELVSILRLHHMIEDEEEDGHDCADYLVEYGTTPNRSGAFEVWDECERCGAQQNRRSDSLL